MNEKNETIEEIVEEKQLDSKNQQAEELRLEEVLAQVEQCIEQLENPQISLEDSFRYYEEGIRKLKTCNEKVDQIEKKMLLINEKGQLEPF